MVLSDLLRQSLRNIASHKRRNLFSAFGVTWGVASILLLAGWGVGVQHYMREGMESFGKDIIVVFQGHTSKGIGGYRAGRVILLYPEDVEAIRAYSSKVKVVVPVDQFDLTVSRNNISESRRVRGVVPEARTMRNLAPERGRFFTMDDIENRRRVCVLGSDVRDRYFKPDEDPLGKEIRIGGITFTVVGVLPEKEQMVSMGGRDKDLIFIPFSTGRRLFAGRNPLFCIMARSFRPEQDEEAVVEIRKALAIKHNFSPDDEEAVWIIPLTKYTKLATTSARAIGIFVAGVGILTLAIGSVGVTNMMLVSVSERIEEIGIRRATGATKYNIIWQFLTETLLLTVIAGGIGFCLGMALLWLVTKLPIPDYIPTPIVSFNVAVVAIIVMVIAGVLAGITPARRAAAIAPADAIKGNVRAWSPKRSARRSVLVLPGLVGEIISQAIDNIRTARLRAALTGFGVFWGVAAVGLLIGWGTATRDQMESQIEQLGGRRTVVYPRRIESKVGVHRRQLLRLTKHDVDDLAYNAWYVEYIGPEITLGFPVVEYGRESRALHTLGIAPEARIIRNFSMAEGRFINQRDVKEKRKVCVLGANAKQKLFGNRSAVGKSVRIRGVPFVVVGVMAAKGEQTSIETSLDDDKVLIPHTTATILTGRRHPDYLTLHPTKEMPYDEIERRVKERILQNHNLQDEEAIGMYSALEARQEISKVMLGLTAFLGGVGVVTLLVGAIGVANIMFVSVAQRTREIGIRRAVGAKRKHILSQFLFEAVLICSISGLLGALFATVIASALGAINLPALFAAPRLSSSVMLIIAAFIGGAGIISGLFPARKAASINVTESLRYE